VIKRSFKTRVSKHKLEKYFYNRRRIKSVIPAAWVIFSILFSGIAIGLLTATLIYSSTVWNKPNNSLYDEQLVNNIVSRTSKAVVEIIIKRPNVPTDSGTGFLLDKDGHIVTNEHVVNGATTIQVSLDNGTVLNAVLLGMSPSDDLALLSVNPKDVEHIEPLQLANSDFVKTGQMALAIGNPLGMRNFVSVGVVAGIGDSPPILRDTRISPALQRPIPNMVWTDAAMLPGNSGGPLLNSSGEVIGINSAVHITYQGDLGIGFAIPSNILVELLPNLKSSTIISRAWLGISGITLKQQSLDEMGLDLTSGVYVWDVYPGSPADLSFLIPDSKDGTVNGDIIIEIDNIQVTSVSQMVHYLNSLQPEDFVTLTIFRNKQPIRLNLKLGSWPPISD